MNSNKTTFKEYVDQNMNKEEGCTEMVIVGIDGNKLTLENGTVLDVPKNIIKNKAKYTKEDIKHHGLTMRFGEYVKVNGRLILS